VLGVFGVLAVAAFVIGAVLVATSRSPGLQQNTADQLVSYPSNHQPLAAAATLPRLGGGAPVSVGGDRGHPMVINFWASWCTECQKELKAVAAVARRHIVAFVGVDTNDTSTSHALSLLRKADATYPVGTDTAALAIKYNAPGLPVTAFVNAKGRVVAYYLGALNKRDLSRWATELAHGQSLTRP
jgi:thiol-disulfide isomerase/thioredoxin